MATIRDTYNYAERVSVASEQSLNLSSPFASDDTTNQGKECGMSKKVSDQNDPACGGRTMRCNNDDDQERSKSQNLGPTDTYKHRIRDQLCARHRSKIASRPHAPDCRNLTIRRTWEIVQGPCSSKADPCYGYLVRRPTRFGYSSR